MKFASLEKMLDFYGDWRKIETLVYECNREGLVCTIIDHRNKVISFDQNIEVAESLINFGAKLRTAFQRITEKRTHGMERARIFMKVKEKLDEETDKVQALKQSME